MSAESEVKNFVQNVRKKYFVPYLIEYGAVRDLTQSGTMGGSENGNQLAGCTPDTTKMSCSERRLKEKVIQVGKHPLGIGLYLFNYKPEYCDLLGHGRQFGVMIDEVETVMPAAVSLHLDGLKRVDYAMLGLTRTIH